MTLDNYLAEFRTDMSSYDAAGLIDDLTVYGWIMSGLRKFGSNIMTLQEDVVKVKKGRAELPENFHSLYAAYKCDRLGYELEKEEDRKVLQKTYMWKETTERGLKWNSCTECCKEEFEKTIVEKLYFNDIPVKFHYTRPILLRLGRAFNKTQIHKECRNRIIRDNPFEIVINKKILQANFDEGEVYVMYYGLDKDEDDTIILPDSNNGYLLQYIDYYVKFKFFEKIASNKDDTNVSSLLQYYMAQEDSYKLLALSDTKMGGLTPNSFKRLKRLNRLYTAQHECIFPNIK